MTYTDEQARALCDAATPADRWTQSWDTRPYARDGFAWSTFATGPQHGVPEEVNTAADRVLYDRAADARNADAAFIAAARTGWPEALDRIAQIRAAVREVLDDLNGTDDRVGEVWTTEHWDRLDRAIAEVTP